MDVTRIPGSLPASPEARSPGAAAPGETTFGDALGRALAGADGLQLEADRQSTAVAVGGGNLHETALALEKADIGMRILTKVRNRLVDAYQEIMRMSV